MNVDERMRLWSEVLRAVEAPVLEDGIAEPDGSLDERRFGELVLRTWRWHVETMPAYRAFCKSRLGALDRVERWQQIPALPVDAFKQAVLACPPRDPTAALRRFTTSGTGGGARVGVSAFDEDALRIMDAAIRVNAARMLFGDGARCRILVLAPPPTLSPHMIIAYGMSIIVQELGAEGSGFFIGKEGVDSAGLLASIDEARRRGEPVCLIGSSFGFVHLCDGLAARGASEVPLPPGSRLMDAGGYKGRSRELAPADFRAMIARVFSLPDHHIVNLLGMTELSSQIYDDAFAARLRGAGAGRRKVCPPWARTRIVSPDEPAVEVAPGEVGLLAHVDLANWSRPLAILSDDLGRAVDGGFQVLGRVSASEARGCSIKVDELLARGA